MRRHLPKMSLSTLVLAAALPAFAGEAPAASKIAPWLHRQLESNGPVEFLVLLDSSVRPPADADLAPAELYAALTKSALADQAGILADLRARGAKARSFYIVNAVLVEGDGALALALAARQDVAAIVGNPRLRVSLGHPPSGVMAAPASISWNLTMVRAPEVWSTYGTQGEGVVVASADTGVDGGHFELADQYRGYDPASGNIDDSYSWHDAFGIYTLPSDDVWHGTHTMGLLVATNGLGVAPGARWIACKNMQDGFGTPASYIDCMEWTLAPYPRGGDPLTDGRPDLAPHIVNNSWSCIPLEGCDARSFDEPLARLRQAGIFMVASAMNTGPSCSTIDQPPAISADVFTVGAMDQWHEIPTFSSRGPVTIDGSGRLKPDLVAPGRLIYSTTPNGSHETKNGTSMAAPHVAGAAALLWSHRPELRGLVGLTSCILQRSAASTVTDPNQQACGGIPSQTLPNNVQGHGTLDIYAAFGLPASDADPAPDVCDCAATDPSAFGVPVEVAGVLVDTGGTVAWNAQDTDTGTGTRYDVLRGDLAALSATKGIDGGSCLERDIATASTGDPALPAPGQGVYYLVRARNTCGDPGWGAGRVSTACD